MSEPSVLLILANGAWSAANKDKSPEGVAGEKARRELRSRNCAAARLVLDIAASASKYVPCRYVDHMLSSPYAPAGASLEEPVLWMALRLASYYRVCDSDNRSR